MSEYINRSELVAICRVNGYDVDRSTPMYMLMQLMGGELVQVVQYPTRQRLLALAEFVKKNRYRLNLECTSVCRECSYGLNIWCSAQVPRAQEVMNDETEEVD